MKSRASTGRSKPSRPEPGSWIVDRQDILIDSPFVKILKKHCTLVGPSKKVRVKNQVKQYTFYTMDSLDWCNIIPVTAEGNLVFIRQHRAGTNSFTLEIPGGVVDPKEDPADAAIRELLEETGYAPIGKKYQLLNLGYTHPNPAILNNRCHLFAVGPVKKVSSQNLDPSEVIEVLEIPIHEVCDAILDGRINHALILNGFFKLMLGQKKLKSSLVNLLSDLSHSSDSKTNLKRRSK